MYPGKDENNSMENKRVTNIMDKKEKPDPERVAILRSLPLEVKQQISGEEAEAFMYNRELPDSLLEKLKDYIVREEE
ncbi:hypothetical protein SAMN02745220_04189 [Desulfopila aestuarii DSM 18488]|uniref:Uncharacterized protein n=2 Tax=Desulfopila aestuarii TaxID=231440 RepID=A0A1M7YGK6_9BACT|nr:hypothetical protein SAMN02745220_04189 [Desulfopila aestuarii DSM 18488]